MFCKDWRIKFLTYTEQLTNTCLCVYSQVFSKIKTIQENITKTVIVDFRGYSMCHISQEGFNYTKCKETVFEIPRNLN